MFFVLFVSVRRGECFWHLHTVYVYLGVYFGLLVPLQPLWAFFHFCLLLQNDVFGRFDLRAESVFVHTFSQSYRAAV